VPADPRIDEARSLRGATLGLVGLGEIGRDVARKAAAFGMRVLYTQRRRLEPAPESALGVESRALPALLAEADVVSVHVPQTPETRNLIGAGEINRMRPGAIPINTSRGGLVDETALITALREGRLGGAGLDVRAEEPPARRGGAGRAADGAPDAAHGREILDRVARVRRGEALAAPPTSGKPHAARGAADVRQVGRPGYTAPAQRPVKRGGRTVSASTVRGRALVAVHGSTLSCSTLRHCGGSGGA